MKVVSKLFENSLICRIAYSTYFAFCAKAFYVHLVEKSPGIGGGMAKLDKTFPTNDCAM